MAKTFFPSAYIDINASSPHPPQTEYRVSIGNEIWGDSENRVIKVQMRYEGKIAGRRSPSYPVGTDDSQRVQLAIEKLIVQNNSDEIKII